MGLLEKLFPKSKDVYAKGFKTFTDIAPVFSKFGGDIYSQELTRACISRAALATEKLKPATEGVEKPEIQRLVDTQPNDWMTWPKFMKRCMTLFEADGDLFIVPGFNKDMTKIVALFPLYCSFAEIVDYKGEAWVRFHFDTGDTSAIELKYVAIISKYPYRSDFFSEDNCLGQTMQLIHTQNEAQDFAMKNGAKIRFIGQLNGQVREEDIKKKRERFVADQLGPKNESGLMLYDQTFSDIRPIEPQSYVMSTDEMDRIENNVFNYFGINKKILQNDFDEDTWSAFYEGKIEPFAIELGEALTSMLFTKTERVKGKKLTFSANRLEYSSSAAKRNMIRDMVDRGIITINEGREMLQMSPVKGGDIRVIRGEYLNADAISNIQKGDDPKAGAAPKERDDKDGVDLSGDDDVYKDSDSHNKGDFED